MQEMSQFTRFGRPKKTQFRAPSPKNEFPALLNGRNPLFGFCNASLGWFQEEIVFGAARASACLGSGGQVEERPAAKDKQRRRRKSADDFCSMPGFSQSLDPAVREA